MTCGPHHIKRKSMLSYKKYFEHIYWEKKLLNLTGTWTFLNISVPLRASSKAISWGVVTITAPTHVNIFCTISKINEAGMVKMYIPEKIMIRGWRRRQQLWPKTWLNKWTVTSHGSCRNYQPHSLKSQIMIVIL